MSAVFPHADQVVKRKCIFRISAVNNVNISLLLLLTCIFQYLSERIFWKKIGSALLGLVFFLLRRNLSKGRYHHNRLNFIKLFISVCFDYPSLDNLLLVSLILSSFLRIFWSLCGWICHFSWGDCQQDAYGITDNYIVRSHWLYVLCKQLSWCKGKSWDADNGKG